MQVLVAVRQQGGAWSFTFTGILSVMGRDFEFDLEKNRAGLFLLASYYHEEGDKVWLHNLLEPLSNDIACLLYTSDAADERSSVDLGGRRIIKKQKTGCLCE